VNEYVRAILASDKTVPFGVVEPLYCAFHTFHLRASTYRQAPVTRRVCLNRNFLAWLRTLSIECITENGLRL
jgi:hypothetical protein